MTVAELIEALKGYNPNLPVKAEGCDCINPVCDVSVGQQYQGGSPYLLIEVEV